MSTTLETFKITNPNSYGAEMMVFYDDADNNKLLAINITNKDRSNNDIRDSLINLISVSINLLGVQRLITPTSATYMGGYWHFLVNSFDLLDGITEELVHTGFTSFTGAAIYEEIAVFNPKPDNIRFSQSEYEVLENNSEAGRTTGRVFKVDNQFKDNSVLPFNIDAIRTETATLAEFQELNYSSEGIQNSRYAGSKTNINTFGVDAALNAKAIRAQIFISSSVDNQICSQSDDQRLNIETVLFRSAETVPAGEQELYGTYPTSGSRIFNLVGNQVIPLRDRKVWIEDTRTIVYIDENGFAISSGIVCTV